MFKKLFGGGGGGGGAAELRKARKVFENIDIPTIEEQEIDLDELSYLGDFTPEMLEALSLGPSAMEGVSADPRLEAAQMAALESLGGIAEGGLSDADMAAIEEARRAVDADQTAREAAILQDMQQRGMGGAGAELAMKLQSAQGAADRQNQAALETSQIAQARALEALMNQAGLAGQVRGQSFGEQSDIARAQDAIKQFNMQNQQRVMDANVAAQNQAGMRNLQTQQQLAGQNTNLRNQQQMYNKALAQQQFQNEMARAGGIAGQYQNMANYIQGKKDRESAFTGGLIQAGVGAGATALAGPGGYFATQAASQKKE